MACSRCTLNSVQKQKKNIQTNVYVFCPFSSYSSSIECGARYAQWEYLCVQRSEWDNCHLSRQNNSNNEQIYLANIKHCSAFVSTNIAKYLLVLCVQSHETIIQVKIIPAEKHCRIEICKNYCVCMVYMCIAMA